MLPKQAADLGTEVAEAVAEERRCKVSCDSIFATVNASACVADSVVLFRGGRVAQ